MRSRCESCFNMDVIKVHDVLLRWRRCEDQEAMVDGLSEDELADITTLIWLAKGLYTPAELREARFEACAALCPAMLQSVARTPQLAECVEAGLELIAARSRLH